jgi:hypothetical protein
VAEGLGLPRQYVMAEVMPGNKARKVWLEGQEFSPAPACILTLGNLVKSCAVTNAATFDSHIWICKFIVSPIPNFGVKLVYFLNFFPFF